jgi:hypothetical protein
VQEDAPVTLLGRMVAAGISEERCQAAIAAGAVRVDGEQVTDPAHLPEASSRIVLMPS